MSHVRRAHPRHLLGVCLCLPTHPIRGFLSTPHVRRDIIRGWRCLSLAIQARWIASCLFLSQLHWSCQAARTFLLVVHSVHARRRVVLHGARRRLAAALSRMYTLNLLLKFPLQPIFARRSLRLLVCVLALFLGALCLLLLWFAVLPQVDGGTSDRPRSRSSQRTRGPIIALQSSAGGHIWILRVPSGRMQHSRWRRQSFLMEAYHGHCRRHVWNVLPSVPCVYCVSSHRILVAATTIESFGSVFLKHPCRLVQVRCAVCTMFSIFSLMFTGLPRASSHRRVSLWCLHSAWAALRGCFGRHVHRYVHVVWSRWIGGAIFACTLLHRFFPSVTQAQGCGGIRVITDVLGLFSLERRQSSSEAEGPWAAPPWVPDGDRHPVSCRDSKGFSTVRGVRVHFLVFFRTLDLRPRHVGHLHTSANASVTHCAARHLFVASPVRLPSYRVQGLSCWTPGFCSPWDSPAPICVNAFHGPLGASTRR